jgi:CheY-like chemotaxis protein
VENGSRSIMMIEDGQEDFEALTRALSKAGIHNPVYRFSHGESALDFLRGRGRYFKPGSTIRPSLVLLDLNLPNVDGREILLAIKGDPRLRAIPVIVLTGSRSPADAEFCYQAGANSYFQKPPTMDGMIELIRSLKNYWFDTAILPSFSDEAGADR